MGKTALKPINIELAKSLLNYDPLTGLLTWKQQTSHRVSIGDVAGGVNAAGYIQVGIGGKRRLGHHLAWVIMTCEQPSGDVDHVNRVRSDNRWSNLRCVDRSDNLLNAEYFNETGFPGVMQMPSGRFRSAIHVNRICTYIGSFDTAEEAHTHYAKRHVMLYGEKSRFHPMHPNHRRFVTRLDPS